MIFSQKKWKQKQINKHKVVVQNLAKEDVKEICKWYNKQQKGLAKQFVAEMKQALFAIERNSTSFAIRFKNLRLANVEIFP